MSKFSAPSKFSPKRPQISGTQVLTFSLLSVGNVRENKLSLFTMKRCERGKTGKNSHFRPRVRLKNFLFTGGVRKREMKEKKRMKGGMWNAGYRANFGSVKYPVTAKLVSRGASLFFLQQEISNYFDLNG